MTDREKVIKGLESLHARLLDVAMQDSVIMLDVSMVANAIAMLKEQEPYKSEETCLNRDEYCRVGDVLDCFDGMDMKADEVFHAVCLIEWAMGKRSVPLSQLLKEQEAVEPEIEVLNEIERIHRCPRCHKPFFYAKQKFCDQCGQAVKWDD